jgi:hypothetical protein
MEDFIMAESTKKTAVKSIKKPVKTKVTPPTVKSAPVAAPAAPSNVAQHLQLTISEQERDYRIQQVAYFRAEKRGFQGDPREDWLAAEAEVEADIKAKGIRVIG